VCILDSIAELSRVDGNKARAQTYDKVSRPYPVWMDAQPPMRRNAYRGIRECPAVTTEELIRGLAADRLIGPRVAISLLTALLLGTGIVALIFFSAIGFRHTTPLSSPGRWEQLLLAPALLLILSVVLELAYVPSTEWATKAIGSNSVNCMIIIPTLGSVPLILFIRALRRGAPSNPALSGALAGLAASGIAATFYAANCFDDSPLFVITWYPLATSILVLSGYFAGLRYLRW
jgi:hypothetical protein